MLVYAVDPYVKRRLDAGMCCGLISQNEKTITGIVNNSHQHTSREIRDLGNSRDSGNYLSSNASFKAFLA